MCLSGTRTQDSDDVLVFGSLEELRLVISGVDDLVTVLRFCQNVSDRELVVGHVLHYPFDFLVSDPCGLLAGIRSEDFVLSPILLGYCCGRVSSFDLELLVI